MPIMDAGFSNPPESIPKIIESSLFLVICSLGASLQLGLVYVMVESRISHEVVLLLAVIAASISNFILNKKTTFKEKIRGWMIGEKYVYPVSKFYCMV